MSLVKRINNKLLSSYPLLWNTRFPVAFGISILINILFFLIGFLAFQYPNDLANRYSIFVDEAHFVLPGILVSLIFLIVWVNYYTRNNAFKTLLPIGKFYLVKEFALVLVLMVSNACYLFSFAKGFQLHAQISVQEVKVAELANRGNRAMFFIPMERDNYEIGNSCDSIFGNYISKRSALRDSIELFLEDSLSASLGMDANDNISVGDRAIDRYMELKYPVQYGIYKDSMERVREQDEIRTSRSEYDEGEMAKLSERKKVYNYRYYCKLRFASYSDLEGLLGSREISAHGVKLVDNQDRKGVLNLLDSFRRDLEAVGGKLLIHDERRVNLALLDTNWYASSDYMVQEIYRHSELDYPDREEVLISNFENFLSNAHQLQADPYKTFPYMAVLLALFYIGLSLTLLLFFFRIVGMKNLLLSIVAISVMGILVSLIFAGYYSLVSYPRTSEERFILTVLSGITALFICLGLVSVLKKWRKPLPHIIYPMFTLVLLGSFPLILGIVVTLTESERLKYPFYGEPEAFSITWNNALHVWIQNHEFLLANAYPWLIVFSFVIVLFPLAKKLQANPHE